MYCLILYHRQNNMTSHPATKHNLGKGIVFFLYIGTIKQVIIQSLTIVI